jgi:hypothetical protein
MFKSKRILRLLSIAVALSLLWRLFIPQNSALASPETRFLEETWFLKPRPLTAPAQPASPSNLQALLNLLVRQALTANGWDVVSLVSQLNPAAGTSAAQQSGAGQWRIELLDENQQPLTLAGTLSYTLTALAQGNLLARAEVKLSGTLSSANVALTLDLRSVVENDGVTLNSTAQSSLRLTRNGKTSTLNLSSTGETKPLAYNLNQSITRSTFDRDGKTGESTQTLTTRVLSRDESEVWLQVDGKGAGAITLSLVQHLFQRVSGARVAQYLDRFDLKTTDNQYTLQAPSGIVSTLDGDSIFAITLVDRTGKPLKLSRGKPPQSFNLPARRVPGLAMMLPTGGIWRDSPPGEFVPLARGGRLAQ